MAQEMNILRCYSCNMYQVHIVRKANKWQCKICNEKQSVKHVYFQGSGQDCRLQVQRLNLKNHTEEEQSLEALEKIEIIEKKHNPVIAMEKPRIAKSKWTKYMVPQTEDYEVGSNDAKYIDPSPDYKYNVSNNTYIPHDNFKFDKKSLNEKLTDEKETGDSLVKKSDLPCTTNTRIPHKRTTNESRLKLLDVDSRNQTASCDYNCDLIKKKEGIVIIRKHVKRKANGENVIPQSQSSSSVSDCETSDTISKQSKLVDASSWQKKSLRDIVKLNRSNAGKGINFKAKERNFTVTNSGLVLKEKNNGDNINAKETEIVTTNARKKTIFETDFDELEEMLDF